MPVLGDETGGLGESAVLVLHDEATLLPVAQQDGKLRLGAMNLTDVLNLSLVKGVMNVEKKIAHTGEYDTQNGYLHLLPPASDCRRNASCTTDHTSRSIR